MGGNGEARLLADTLSASDLAALPGVDIACGPTGGVVVTRDGHARGVWHAATGVYRWTPGGYSAPTFQTTSVDDAVDFTRRVLGGH